MNPIYPKVAKQRESLDALQERLFTVCDNLYHLSRQSGDNLSQHINELAAIAVVLPYQPAAEFLGSFWQDNNTKKVFLCSQDPNTLGISANYLDYAMYMTLRLGNTPPQMELPKPAIFTHGATELQENLQKANQAVLDKFWDTNPYYPYHKYIP